jgi:uncharacterized membrane protein YgcG
MPACPVSAIGNYQRKDTLSVETPIGCRTTMMVKCFFVMSIFLFSLPLLGQSTRLEGRVIDGKRKAPLGGVFLKLAERDDTSRTYSAVSGADGTFIFFNIRYTTYRLSARIVDHELLEKIVYVGSPEINLGDIAMSERVFPMREVVVNGIPPPAVQKGDTTEFNAGAFRTHPDADAGDLISKMPGVTVDNTGVKAQGENVQQVLVDGRQFFGNDPMVALRTLPAEVIEKIQVFDKMTDQAEFTGFDDGQSMKTINIITKKDKQNQEFGKSYGGYGDDDRYLAGGGLNYFLGNTRLSLIGLADNVNQQNFTTQDLFGVLGTTNQRGGNAVFRGGSSGRRGGGSTGSSALRGGGGQGGSGSGSLSNFLVGPQNGITSTVSVGANYNDLWGSNIVINQSYFFNYSDAQNDQNLHREYLGAPDSITQYNETTNSDKRNYNHRYDMRMEYTRDSSNSLIEIPRVYFQNTASSSDVIGATSFPTGQLINQTDNNNPSNTSGYNLSNHLVLRHKFASPGRTISLDIGLAANRKSGSSLLQSATEYYATSGNLNDTTNQSAPLLTDGYTLSSRLAYTEPVGTNGQIQVTYYPSYSSNRSDNQKYQFDSMTRDYSTLIPSLSNTYRNDYTTQNGGVGFHFRRTGFNGMVNLAYQVALLRGEQVFPQTSDVNRSFYDFLPNAMLTYNISEHKNIRLNYVASTKPPSISQLQNVVDNTNPLLLATGNPNLKQSLSQSLIGRFLQTDVDQGQSFFLVGSVGFTNDYIGNSTLVAQKDSTLTGGVVMNQGTQLTVPVNLDGYWTARLFGLYGFPVFSKKSNFNLNSGYTLTQTPSLVNNVANLSKSSAVNAGAVLTSNISEDVDFTVSYTGAYNISTSTLSSGQNGKYFSHNGSVKFNLIFWDGVVFRNEMTATIYSGLSAGYNQNSLLWNINLGKKFFENQRGDLRCIINDVLDQNKSINRLITDTYVQDTQNETLRRYVMLQFTYTIR